MFRVDPKTVVRWAREGKIGTVRTLGGHRRFRRAEVDALMEAGTTRRRFAGAGPRPEDEPLSPPTPNHPVHRNPRVGEW